MIDHWFDERSSERMRFSIELAVKEQKIKDLTTQNMFLEKQVNALRSEIENVQVTGLQSTTNDVKIKLHEIDTVLRQLWDLHTELEQALTGQD